ncbi:MAG: 3-methyl-2-oxobutanoate hydroxymethyltransferase [Fimbriimonadaceae bacterium]
MGSKRTAPGIRAMKAKGERIVCVTAYDFPSGAIADASGVDLVLVGDSLGNVVLGYENTLPVTLEEMEHHTRATRRGVRDALFVADLPFGSYQSSVSLAVESAVRLMKAGAEAVKLEGAYVEAIRGIVRAGIPVMGHVGMTPQSVNAFGGFKVQGKGEDSAHVREAACQTQEAGAFAIVLELMPAALAQKITQDLEIPTIGIGAGPHCDGEIQVFHDVMGLSADVYKHSRDYVGARALMTDGLSRYAADVRAREFPADENSF